MKTTPFLKSSALLQRLRDKHVSTWLPGYVTKRVGDAMARVLRPAQGTRHLIVAVCDHFEPNWRTRDRAVADARSMRWRQEYPALAHRYRDSTGRHPRHTFFVPCEEIEESALSDLEVLCRAGLAEVEVHLHHEDDDAASLRAQLERGVTMLADRGHLSRAEDGRPRYGFIHGNWALANALPDGRHCGVDDELRVLFATGCYADFTFPAFPDASQPSIVNRLYWPAPGEAARRSADRGTPARVGAFPLDRPLLVQGPLVPTWTGKRGGVRVDYGALTAHDPATPSRLRSWLDAAITVEGKPEWTFVKLHTHGAPEAQATSLLGAGGRALHDALAERVRDGGWQLHYVTARELYNIAAAAMLGRGGNPSDHRNARLTPPPVARQGT